MIHIEFELNEKHQGAFRLYDDDTRIGEMVVSVSESVLTVYHTEVDDDYAGKGLAKQLLDEMVAYAREHGLKVIPLCSYVHAQFKRHPELYKDVWMQ